MPFAHILFNTKPFVWAVAETSFPHLLRTKELNDNLLLRNKKQPLFSSNLSSTVTLLCISAPMCRYCC